MKYFQIHLTIPKTTSSSSCVDWETKPKIFLLAVNENPTSTSLSLFDFHISLSLALSHSFLDASKGGRPRRQRGRRARRPGRPRWRAALVASGREPRRRSHGRAAALGEARQRRVKERRRVSSWVPGKSANWFSELDRIQNFSKKELGKTDYNWGKNL